MKILIIGIKGSGKTTLLISLKKVFKAEFIEMNTVDAENHTGRYDVVFHIMCGNENYNPRLVGLGTHYLTVNRSNIITGGW